MESLRDERLHRPRGLDAAGGPTAGSSSTGLNELPASDAPADYDVLSYVKMEAAATNGSAEGYFDDFAMTVASPQCTSAEFVYRNSPLSSLGGQNAAGSPFTIFPAREMGQNNHSNQFNFGITEHEPVQGHVHGHDPRRQLDLCPGQQPVGAVAVQPARHGQHPRSSAVGIPGAGQPPWNHRPVSDVVRQNAFGADAVEVRTGADYSNPSDIPNGDAWDQIR